MDLTCRLSSTRATNEKDGARGNAFVRIKSNAYDRPTYSCRSRGRLDHINFLSSRTVNWIIVARTRIRTICVRGRSYSSVASQYREFRFSFPLSFSLLPSPFLLAYNNRTRGVRSRAYNEIRCNYVLQGVVEERRTKSTANKKMRKRRERTRSARRGRRGKR